MPTTNDLIGGADLIAQLDYIARFDRRTRTVCGTGTEALSTTLNGAINATVLTLTLGAPSSGTWAAVLPRIGTILIGNEYLDYSAVVGNVLTISRRGAEDSAPAAHSNGDTVYLPGSVAALGRALKINLVGDGSTAYGQGADKSEIIEDLIGAYGDAFAYLTDDAVFLSLSDNYISALQTHIASIAPFVLTGVPSYASTGYTVPSIEDYLRYLNDANTGTPFLRLAHPRAAKAHWLALATYLNPKTVFPERTTLYSGQVTGAGPTISITAGSEINRYNDDSNPDTYVQGFAAQAVQARVTEAGAGNLALVMTAEGMKADGTYFGRASNGGNDGTTTDPDPLEKDFTGTLDMSAVGNVIPLVNGTHRILAGTNLALGVGGTATSGRFVIETIPERRVL